MLHYRIHDPDEASTFYYSKYAIATNSLWWCLMYVEFLWSGGRGLTIGIVTSSMLKIIPVCHLHKFVHCTVMTNLTVLRVMSC